MRRTVAEVAREIGLDAMGVTYDTALPQGFVYEAEDMSKASPLGHFVWLYDSRGGVFGRPYPLDHVGVDILHVYNRETSHYYPEDRFFG